GVINLHTEVARLSADLNRDTILEAEKDEEILRLKTTPLEFASFFRSQFQYLVQKFLASHEFSRVQGELLSLAASLGFERVLSMHQTKDEFADVLKKMAHFMPSAQGRLDEASPLLLKLIMPFSTRFLSMLLNLYRLSFSLSLKIWLVRPTSPLQRMLGISHVLDDVAEVTTVGSERVSFGHTDVVVALSVGEKGDGSFPSFAIDEEPVANHSGVTSFTNNASQSMAWLDVLKFKRMAYECIFSSGLTRIIPTPEPSSIISLPRHSISSSPSFGIANVYNLFSFLFILRRASSASFIQSDSVAASILMRTLLMGYLSSASFGINLPMVVSCRNNLCIWFGLLGMEIQIIACTLSGSALTPPFVTIWSRNLPSSTPNEDASRSILMFTLFNFLNVSSTSWTKSCSLLLFTTISSRHISMFRPL
ncbi:hypothetical protein Tco_0928043, partial [Tanacetum coccineum]